jgi:hypothetical protein
MCVDRGHVCFRVFMCMPTQALEAQVSHRGIASGPLHVVGIRRYHWPAWPGDGIGSSLWDKLPLRLDLGYLS